MLPKFSQAWIIYIDLSIYLFFCLKQTQHLHWTKQVHCFKHFLSNSMAELYMDRNVYSHVLYFSYIFVFEENQPICLSQTAIALVVVSIAFGLTSVLALVHVGCKTFKKQTTGTALMQITVSTINFTSKACVTFTERICCSLGFPEENQV